MLSVSGLRYCGTFRQARDTVVDFRGDVVIHLREVKSVSHFPVCVIHTEMTTCATWVSMTHEEGQFI